VAKSAEQMRTECPKTAGGALGLACSFRGEDYCKIVRRDEATINAKGYTLETVMRHEVGHCNGWPEDHAGAR